MREDFPTALSEQMKERQNAERQAALYHEMINQQEESDSVVAQQLADQLRADAEQRRLAMIYEDESLGHQLQHSMHLGEARAAVRHHDHPPVPPKNFPQKLSPAHQLLQQHSPTNSLDHHSRTASPQSQTNASSPLHYVTIDLPTNGQSSSTSSTRHPIPMNIPSRTHYSQILPQQPAAIMNSPVRSHYDHLELQSHTPEKPRVAPNDRDPNLNHSAGGGGKSLAFAQSPVDFGAAAAHDEIRPIGEHDQFPFNVNQSSRVAAASHRQHGASIEHNLDEAAGRSNDFMQQLSLEKYDQIMGNMMGVVSDERSTRGTTANVLDNDGSRNMDRIRTMQECGVPADEIVEINRRITQQERDEVKEFDDRFDVFNMYKIFFCRNWLESCNFKRIQILRSRNKIGW